MRIDLRVVFLIACCIGVVFYICYLVWTLIVQYYKRSQRRKQTINGKPVVFVGFFHPYCNAGGGGERVLWSAVSSLQQRYPNIRCIVYTGDTDASKSSILDRVCNRFNIYLPTDVDFVFLQRRKFVEASMYPVFTLLGQSFGSMILGTEALTSFLPDVFIDTMGYAFVLPIFKYFGRCKVGCYVHYPTISTDMLQRVSSRAVAQNNRRLVARSPFLTTLKLQYYRAFAALYGLVGRSSDVVMVNSTWTKNHIVSLWKQPEKTFLVYPPCNVTEFHKVAASKERNGPLKKILSIAQFRTEKDHQLQLKAFAVLVKKLPSLNIQLVLVGSCRNEDDLSRVNELQQLCRELRIREKVVFKLNISFSELLKEMSESLIGIHTMWNEHFGIGIVESMAAGLIMVAHDSGGPKLDILTEFNGKPTGFLASTAEGYAEVIENILRMSSEEQEEIRQNAFKSVARFSEEKFNTHFVTATQLLFI